MKKVHHFSFPTTLRSGYHNHTVGGAISAGGGGNAKSPPGRKIFGSYFGFRPPVSKGQVLK